MSRTTLRHRNPYHVTLSRPLRVPVSSVPTSCTEDQLSKRRKFEHPPARNTQGESIERGRPLSRKTDYTGEQEYPSIYSTCITTATPNDNDDDDSVAYQSRSRSSSPNKAHQAWLEFKKYKIERFDNRDPRQLDPALSMDLVEDLWNSGPCYPEVLEKKIAAEAEGEWGLRIALQKIQPSPYHPKDPEANEGLAQAGYAKLLDVFNAATSCSKNHKDENAWAFKVAWPLVELDYGDDRLKNWDLNSIQTQSILDVHQTPGVTRKADLALFYNRETTNDEQVLAVYRLFDELNLPVNVSHLTDAWTSKLIGAMFFEIKLANLAEAEVQLVSMITSAVGHRMSLRDECAKRFPGKADEIKKREIPPVVGWVVEKHRWMFWMCYVDGEMRRVHTPEYADGSTSTTVRIAQLREKIQIVKRHSYKTIEWLRYILNPQ